jgi:hypothetical protein
LFPYFIFSSLNSSVENPVPELSLCPELAPPDPDLTLIADARLINKIHF